ncbi:MAG: TRCF domain-containing protein, partial [Bacillota bacterium]
NEADALDTIDELIDRFGEPPLEVMRLINISRLKFLAAELNIELIKEEKGKIKCQFISSEVVNGSKLVKFSQKYKRKVKIKSAKKPQLLIKIESQAQIDKKLFKMLKTLKNI